MADEKEDKKPRDLRQEVTDKMIEVLDKGEIPWNKPWESFENGLPRNMATGREYNGANSLMLMMAGYHDPRFGTFRQVNELGGKVTRGEKGIPIEFWGKEPFYQRRDTTVKYLDRAYKVFSEDRDVVHIGGFKDSASTLAIRPSELKVHHQGKVLTWDEAHKSLDRSTVRTYVVFNVEQCTDLEKLHPLDIPDRKIPVNERAEQIMAAMKKDGLAFAEHPEHAFYSPRRDQVSLPPKQNFTSVEGYYGTALHEIGHATGATQRLNRDGITGGHQFGTDEYAKEELRAEIFSAFMAVQTGIPHDMMQHQAYVQNWAQILRKDKHEIFRAAADASKAVDYVLGKEQSLELTLDHISSIKAEQPAAQVQMAEKLSAYETAIMNYVEGGGNEKNGRALLDEDLGRFHSRNLPAALVYNGFATPSTADRLATAIVAEKQQHESAVTKTQEPLRKILGVRDTEHSRIEGTLHDFDYKLRELALREADGQMTTVKAPDGLSLANYQGMFGAGPDAVKAAETLVGQNIALIAHDHHTATLEVNGKMLGRGVADQPPIPFLSREMFVLKPGEPGVSGKILEIFAISDELNPQHIVAAELQTDKGIVLAHRHDHQPMRELLGMKDRHVELAVAESGGLQIKQSEKEQVPVPPRAVQRTYDGDREIGR